MFKYGCQLKDGTLLLDTASTGPSVSSTSTVKKINCVEI